MALVLRKAVLPKNVSLLKWIKGRPLATAAKRNDATAISTPVPCQSMRDEKRLLTQGYKKIANAKQMSTGGASSARGKNIRMRYSMSCPHFDPEARMQPNLSRNFSSYPRPKSSSQSVPNAIKTRSLSAVCLQRDDSLLQASVSLDTPQRGFAGKPCPSPCPCPCGCGSCCLPPPCNTPAKCIQYMTGYYYYPYGFWFCGPYHVTGTCTPVGPCNPACCKPCCPCPCPKCCACLHPSLSGIVPQVSPNIQVPFPQTPIPQSPYTPVFEPQTPCPESPNPQTPRTKSPVGNPTMHFRPLSPPKAQTSSTPSSTVYSQATTRAQGQLKTQASSRVMSMRPPVSIRSQASPKYQANVNVQAGPSASRSTRSVISKFFPFQTAQDTPTAKKPPSTCMICPYSTQTGVKIEEEPAFCTPSFSLSATRNSIRTIQLCPVDPYPKYPKSYISGAYSRSFHNNYERKDSLKPKGSHPVCMPSGDGCPPLENPRMMLSPEQRDRPRIEPGAFDYSIIPNYKNPFPIP